MFIVVKGSCKVFACGNGVAAEIESDIFAGYVDHFVNSDILGQFDCCVRLQIACENLTVQIDFAVNQQCDALVVYGSVFRCRFVNEVLHMRETR